VITWPLNTLTWTPTTFVNLFAGSRGQAWTYASVYDLVLRLRERTGIDFDPHWFRHLLSA